MLSSKQSKKWLEGSKKVLLPLDLNRVAINGSLQADLSKILKKGRL
jgi:hypothetical protein